MPIIEIESEWRATGIRCPFCEGEHMTYSDGQHRPQCANSNCLRVLPDQFIWTWLDAVLAQFPPNVYSKR